HRGRGPRGESRARERRLLLHIGKRAGRTAEVGREEHLLARGESVNLPFATLVRAAFMCSRGAMPVPLDGSWRPLGSCPRPRLLDVSTKSQAVSAVRSWLLQAGRRVDRRLTLAAKADPGSTTHLRDRFRSILLKNPVAGEAWR